MSVVDWLSGSGLSANQSSACPRALQALRSPGLSVHRGAADEADGLLREGQADQQRAGPTRTRENLLVYVFVCLFVKNQPGVNIKTK